MLNFNNNTKNNDEWLTPPDLVKKLGVFDLDPCSPINRPWDTAKNHYSISDGDGLIMPWYGRVWLNPPYGRETFKWLDRLSEHGSGLGLIFARTDTKGFHRTVLNKAHSIFFIEGRLCFHYVDGTKGDRANAPSCLVSYSEYDTAILRMLFIKGKLVVL